MLVLARLLEPLWVRLGLLHAEARGGEQGGRREGAVLGDPHLRLGVDLAQERLDRTQLLRRNQVTLIDQEQVGKLELVDLVTGRIRGRVGLHLGLGLGLGLSLGLGLGG